MKRAFTKQGSFSLNQVLASEITGKSLISKRFADKVIRRNHELIGQSELGKKGINLIKLMMECVLLLYDDRIAHLKRERIADYLRKHGNSSEIQ